MAKYKNVKEMEAAREKCEEEFQKYYAENSDLEKLRIASRELGQALDERFRMTKFINWLNKKLSRNEK